MNQNIQLIIFCTLFVLAFSCTKEKEFLDEKPNASLLVPASLDDYELLLLGEGTFNANSDPAIGSVSTEEYYLTTDLWSALSAASDRNAYIWEKDIWQNEAGTSNWANPYRQVYYANIVLDGIDKLDISSSEITKYNRLKGTALFYRAYVFSSMLQLYSQPYDSATAAADLGIPLRLSSDFNINVQRANVKESYDQIIQDLEKALSLLPANAAIRTQPSKCATNALLARIYLSMRAYAKAFQYANAALLMNNSIVDYNSLTPGTTALSTNYLAEDIYHVTQSNPGALSRNTMIVDSSLYKLYAANDLRRSHFFTVVNGQNRFRGTYDYKGNRFSGLATDELYLIRAECSARGGNVSAAMNDLNTLLQKRWKSGTYIDMTAVNETDAIAKILTERRKELCFRGIRLSDLKRLNREGYNLSITRVINGKTYILPPNSPLYQFPIPNIEINLSGIQQNPR
jgi:starch-binding outer membrane protein, SusD/RagB family